MFLLRAAPADLTPGILLYFDTRELFIDPFALRESHGYHRQLMLTVKRGRGFRQLGEQVRLACQQVIDQGQMCKIIIQVIVLEADGCV